MCTGRRRPLPPDGGLGQPVRDFADTFSAETVLMEMFFPDLAKRERLAAATQIDDGPVTVAANGADF